MSEKATLYFFKCSPPARAALLGIRYLNVDVELKNIDLFVKEQKSEAFLKVNPVGKVPVFVDADGFTLSESRAILAYLVNTRQPESDLYPNDAKKKALIDQRLYFDATILFPSCPKIVGPIIYRGATSVDKAIFEELKNAVELLEGYLRESEYCAGDKMTIADISILANITTFMAYNFDFTGYPKILAWYDKMRSIPGFDENEAGARMLNDFLTKKIGKSIF